MNAWLTALESAAIPALADMALKGALLLALAGLATAALWRASAAMRHLVWSLAMAGLLALPLLSALLPQWRVLPQWSALSKVEGHAPAPTAARPPVPVTPAATPTPQNMPLTATEPVFAPSSTAAQLPEMHANDSQPSAGKPARPWSDWLLPFWIGGAALMLLPEAVGRVALWRLSRSARPVRSGSWTALLQALMRQMRLRRRVILLETDRPVMPMAWGIRRARVLVPAESEKWTAERRRAVLLHEMAHVRRRDCLTQFLTNLACALHWFNPLVWIARRRMITERERACDDLVLTAGFEPSDYAQHLLQIASTLRGGLLTSGAAIAMARPSKLEGRLLAVLDEKRNRRAVTRSVILIGLLAALGLAIPLAALGAVKDDANLPPAYEKAPGSGPELSIKVGPNTFTVDIVARNDRDGSLHFEDGHGKRIGLLDYKTPADMITQALWKDIVLVQMRQPLNFDIIETRVFDHESHEMVLEACGDREYGESRGDIVAERFGDSVIRISHTGSKLPDNIDLWFRLQSYPEGDKPLIMRPEAGQTVTLEGNSISLMELRAGCVSCKYTKSADATSACLKTTSTGHRCKPSLCFSPCVFHSRTPGGVLHGRQPRHDRYGPANGRSRLLRVGQRQGVNGVQPSGRTPRLEPLRSAGDFGLRNHPGSVEYGQDGSCGS